MLLRDVFLSIFIVYPHMQWSCLMTVYWCLVLPLRQDVIKRIIFPLQHGLTLYICTSSRHSAWNSNRDTNSKLDLDHKPVRQKADDPIIKRLFSNNTALCVGHILGSTGSRGCRRGISSRRIFLCKLHFLPVTKIWAFNWTSDLYLKRNLHPWEEGLNATDFLTVKLDYQLISIQYDA